MVRSTVATTYNFTNRKDLKFFMQVIQVLIFPIAHCFIFVLIDRIFVIAIREQLQWIQWKFHYT